MIDRAGKKNARPTHRRKNSAPPARKETLGGFGAAL